MSFTSDDTPGPRAIRSDGWTTERQFGFLEELAAHGNVERAAQAVGMSASSAYRLRARDTAGAFAFGWRAASAMAYYTLRDLAIERVTRGVTVPVLHRGEMVATKAVFSDRLLISLLKHLQPVAGASAADGSRRPVPDPGIAYAAAVEAFTVAIETGVEPVVPEIDDGTGPALGPTEADIAAARRRDARRAKRWFEVTGEKLTEADLDDAASMADLDADIREYCAIDRRGGAVRIEGRTAVKTPTSV